MKYRIIKRANGVYQIEQQRAWGEWDYISDSTALNLAEAEAMLDRIIITGHPLSVQDVVIKEVEVRCSR